MNTTLKVTERKAHKVIKTVRLVNDCMPLTDKEVSKLEAKGYEVSMINSFDDLALYNIYKITYTWK